MRELKVWMRLACLKQRGGGQQLIKSGQKINTKKKPKIYYCADIYFAVFFSAKRHRVRIPGPGPALQAGESEQEVGAGAGGH